MDQAKHWNRISANYNNEIFDVFQSDRYSKLAAYFKKHGNRKHNAIDFGCGVGKAFAYMSPLFNSILATDISKDCLAIAQARGYSNITYKAADLTNKRIKFPKVDFAFCCNVVMLPEMEHNLAMIANIQQALKPKAKAVIVVPSIESALFSTWRVIDWYKKSNIAPSAIDKAELSYFKRSKVDILQGLLDINGVTTKHYSREELEVIFERAKLGIVTIDKIEYDWTSEFVSPPQWMKAPYPWDWLIECENN